ncbi:hypothetical protein BJV78DRAFT_180078 [Lactifluus subvellereus]|nr:hypothetical protein BJV78DRAFT_180078 [Lactifluus subvellereus]
MATPVFAAADNNSALELHRTQSTHGPSPSSSPTQDQIMQAAFQQLMQSPGQVQRLMQLLSSSSTNASNSIPTPLTGPAQSASWSPPASVDLPQLAQLALYDSSIGGGNNALTFDRDIVGPNTAQLTEDEAHLARTYHNASDISADVDVLQANIDAFMENLGLDSAALATTTTASAQPLGHPSSGGTPPAPTATDFDFDAFLTAFSNEQDGANVVDVAVDGIGSVTGSASGSGPTSGTGRDAIKVLPEEQPGVAGHKRTSDVAELELPLPAPSTTAPSRAVAGGGDANTSNLPRAKRNKK